MDKKNQFLLLAGGVGAAKFIDGLANIIPQENMNIIVNTGDDIKLFGLNICPDLDIITYTLANVVDKEKGWGFVNESFNSLRILRKYYNFDWFNIGDKDLATHIYRTDMLNQGFTKSEITNKICKKLGVKSNIYPMSNEPVSTYIETEFGKIHFEEYFIKHQCNAETKGIIFQGIENAEPVPGVLDLFSKVNKIIICPSNPIVSINTILSIKGIKKKLIENRKKVYAISPIIQGATVKGPADKFMKYLGMEVSSVGVAKFYRDIISHFVIDVRDKELKSLIEDIGINTYLFDTLMSDLRKKIELAQFVIDL